MKKKGFILFIIILTLSYCDNKEIANTEFSKISVINISLSWESGDRVVDTDHQLHYLQQLIFDHKNKIITDDIEYYIGLNSDDKKKNRIERENDVYLKLKDLLGNESFYKKYENTDSCEGPIPAKITFIYKNKKAETYYSFSCYFSPDNSEIKVLTEELSNFLNDLHKEHNIVVM